MRARLIFCVFLTGCGSSWDIRKGDKLEIGCRESYFYADADGDGWGDPTSDAAPMCNADVQAGLTASNGRDCDDGDSSITGQVGSSCPGGLVGSSDGQPVPHGGVAFDQAEFAYVVGSAPVVRHGAAIQSCAGWGGATEDAGVWIDKGTLATFGSQPELEAVRDAIEAEVVAGIGVYAGFVGVHWDGAALDDGEWAWVDESGDPGLIEGSFSWCGGVEPVPADFFPLLNPGAPEHVPAINSQLPELRLAMVLTDIGDWCLGLPWHAIPGPVWDDMQMGNANYGDPVIAELARYTTSDGHLVCKRPKPDPLEYQHLVEDEQ